MSDDCHKNRVFSESDLARPSGEKRLRGRIDRLAVKSRLFFGRAASAANFADRSRPNAWALSVAVTRPLQDFADTQPSSYFEEGGERRSRDRGVPRISALRADPFHRNRLA